MAPRSGLRLGRCPRARALPRRTPASRWRSRRAGVVARQTRWSSRAQVSVERTRRSFPGDSRLRPRVWSLSNAPHPRRRLANPVGPPGLESQNASPVRVDDSGLDDSAAIGASCGLDLAPNGRPQAIAAGAVGSHRLAYGGADQRTTRGVQSDWAWSSPQIRSGRFEGVTTLAANLAGRGHTGQKSKHATCSVIAGAPPCVRRLVTPGAHSPSRVGRR